MASFRCVKLLVLIQILQLVISCEVQRYHLDRNEIIRSSSENSCTYPLNNTKNNAEIVFSSRKSYFITNNISFSRKIGLHLIGGKGVAKINCSENTGIAFVDITNLYFDQLHISGCGNEHQNGGVTITNCTHVRITRVTIERSWTTGLALLNTGGVVVIQNCLFLNNSLIQRSTSHTYTFEGKGGGLQIIIGNRQSGSVYNIVNCTFENNTATDGGGLFLVIHEGAENNNVNIEDTNFEHNKCENAGGGLNIEYVKMTDEKSSITKNLVVVRKSTFSKNSALLGGGTAFLSSQELQTNNITFEECHWEKNNASFGMAVDVSIVSRKTILLGEKHLISPVFVNCVFKQNANPSLSDASTVGIIGYKVQFSGTTVFQSNFGSCIEVITTILDFHTYSYVLFQDNYGVRGAAIKMDDHSVLNFRDDSIFRFTNNTASVRGGAIYVKYTTKHLYFLPHQKCFLHYEVDAKRKSPKNVTFEFERNYAGNFYQTYTQGDSIYITYLPTCIKDCILPIFKNMTVTPIPDNKKCLGNFIFNEWSHDRYPISTYASHFIIWSEKKCLEIKNKNSTLHFVPGKRERLCVKLANDLEMEMPFKVLFSVLTRNCSVYNARGSYLTNNSLTLHGKPGDIAFVKLSVTKIRTFDLTFKVEMDECPPGFAYDHSSQKCVCSNRNLYYMGIKICKHYKFEAAIQYGYWIGYISKTNKTEKSKVLASSICPYGYCTKDFYKPPKRHTFLPANASHDLSLTMCHKGRKGVVCGSCRENHSVYYNSDVHQCESNDLCHLGWLFYILSELIPVTILFLIIVVFNISFTSGPLNGIIFFMQIVSTLKIQADNFIWFEPDVYRLHQVARFVYAIFSLHFFYIDTRVSFCLWEGATALDILAFRYVTILYSLVLVIATVFLLRQCNRTFCGKSLPTFKGSVIHGLSAFLVMSYSVCTRVSLSILTPSTLHIGPDYRNNPQYDYVAYYNGDYSYMGPQHLRYAIPAIFFIITVAIIPPLLLLSYPLCYKLFVLLKIDESKFVQITCKIIPLEKIKPFFDSMQGAFKDRYRFFAGLYFLYRLVCLLSFALSDTFTKHYMLSGVFFALMMTAHAAVRPYKKGWQNLLEAGLFLNLFTINTLTFYNFYSLEHQKKENLVALTAIQNILILLPLLYLVSYVVYYLIGNFRSLCRRHRLFQETTDSSDTILDALDRRDPDSDCEEESISYKLL